MASEPSINCTKTHRKSLDGYRNEWEVDFRCCDMGCESAMSLYMYGCVGVVSLCAVCDICLFVYPACLSVSLYGFVCVCKGDVKEFDVF